jgi:catechol 2,3-dioxygenase-like lactoylglutathione lyase family enzyme
MAEMRIESINAVTLAVHDMSRSVRFYTALGFSVRYGGELHAGSGYLNLIAQPVDRHWSWWGRVILCPAPLLAGGLERARREKPHVAG